MEVVGEMTNEVVLRNKMNLLTNKLEFMIAWKEKGYGKNLHQNQQDDRNLIVSHRDRT